jgi:hypothetical protein
VADHGDAPPFGLEAAQLGRLVRRLHPRDHPLDAEPIGDRRGGALVSAGEQHRRETGIEPARGRGRAGLHRSAASARLTGPV